MNSEKLIESLGYIDPELVERAERRAEGGMPEHRHITRRFVACAACLTLAVALGISAAFAGGLFDGKEEYFSGTDEKYVEEIMSVTATVSNDEMLLRIDGAAADEHMCHLLISFVGLTQETKNRFSASNNLDEQKTFSPYALTAAGERVEFSSWESGSYTKDGGLGRRSKSMLPDADITFLVICTFTQDITMSEVEKICFPYEGLTLELDLADLNIAPGYKLYPEEPAESIVADLYVSRLGYCFTVSLDSEAECTFDIRLIRKDGSLYEQGYRGSSGYSDGDESCQVYGNWCGGSSISVAVIDLDEYCGVQINGENYYFTGE